MVLQYRTPQAEAKPAARRRTVMPGRAAVAAALRLPPDPIPELNADGLEPGVARATDPLLPRGLPAVEGVQELTGQDQHGGTELRAGIRVKQSRAGLPATAECDRSRVWSCVNSASATFGTPPRSKSGCLFCRSFPIHTARSAPRLLGTATKPEAFPPCLRASVLISGRVVASPFGFVRSLIARPVNPVSSVNSVRLTTASPSIPAADLSAGTASRATGSLSLRGSAPHQCRQRRR